ncbi:MAG: hypothetical protein JRH20_00860 [Deltaproteobacteria bacterium]|nr:hypothetical protein [Deltaproteobacteria bacterium]
MKPTAHWRALLALVALFPIASGCMTIRHEKVASTLAVSTTPANAWVWTKNTEGKQMVGRAPTDVRVETSVARYHSRRWLTWGSAVVGAVLTIVGVSMASSSKSDDYTVDTTPILLGTGGASLALYGLMFGIMGEAKHGDRVGEAPTVQVGASLSGHEDAWASFALPAEKKTLALRLTPSGRGPISAPALKTLGDRPIVAVFDIEDQARALKSGVADQLTEYLSTQVAAVANLRVIPRSQLRTRLSQQKKRSYKNCYDQACQIELGRALAAHHSLATKILRVGDTCAITSVLYDLKSETSLMAASAETNCSVNGMMAGVRTIASQLASKR